MKLMCFAYDKNTQIISYCRNDLVVVKIEYHFECK
jgi:hypothetical protein